MSLNLEGLPPAQSDAVTFLAVIADRAGGKLVVSETELAKVFGAKLTVVRHGLEYTVILDKRGIGS